MTIGHSSREAAAEIAKRGASDQLDDQCAASARAHATTATPQQQHEYMQRQEDAVRAAGLAAAGILGDID